MGTGHLPDLTMVTPMFRDDRLVAFVASIAHPPDRGGTRAMGLAGELRAVDLEPQGR
jgi:N-methylhydantoinase B